MEISGLISNILGKVAMTLERIVEVLVYYEYLIKLMKIFH